MKNAEQCLEAIIVELNTPSGNDNKRFDRLHHISQLINEYYGEKKAYLYLRPDGYFESGKENISNSGT